MAERGLGQEPTDEEIRRLAREILGRNPTVRVRDFVEAWRIYRRAEIRLAEAARARELFEREFAAWRARPDYEQELAAWRAGGTDRGGQSRGFAWVRETLLGETLLGAAVIAAVTWPVMGTCTSSVCIPCIFWSNAWGLIAMGVAVSYGGGLVVLLLLSWVVGWIVLAALRGITGAFKSLAG
jgi:hypothetical protein